MYVWKHVVVVAYRSKRNKRVSTSVPSEKWKTSERGVNRFQMAHMMGFEARDSHPRFANKEHCSHAHVSPSSRLVRPTWRTISWSTAHHWAGGPYEALARPHWSHRRNDEWSCRNSLRKRRAKSTFTCLHLHSHRNTFQALSRYIVNGNNVHHLFLGLWNLSEMNSNF